MNIWFWLFVGLGVFLCWLVGEYAAQRGRNRRRWFIFSLILSPCTGMLALLVLKRKTETPNTSSRIPIVFWFCLVAGTFAWTFIFHIYEESSDSAVESTDPPRDGTAPAQRDADIGRVAPQNQTSAAQVPVITVSADQLVADYKANEVAADAKYKGNWLYVRGVVAEIGNDFSDEPYVRIGTGGNEFESIHAKFKKAAAPQLATLRKGQTVTLTCLGKGMIIGSPVMDCTRDDAPTAPAENQNAAPTSALQ